MGKKISYKAMVSSHTLDSFNETKKAFMIPRGSESEQNVNHAQDETKESSQEGGQKMAENVSWDEALSSSGYVKLEQDTRKTLAGKNVKLERVEKFGEEVVELSMDIVEEDDQPVEKVFNTSSKRLLRKLRPLFESVAPEVEVRFSVKKIGDKFDTAYDVEQM